MRGEGCSVAVLPTVLDIADDHAIALDLVADDIGWDRHQFATSTSRGSTPLGKLRQTVPSLHQPTGQSPRSVRIKLGDIGTNQLKPNQRPSRPDYFSHSAGAGASSGVPQVASHAVTSAWPTTRPAAKSASASASASRSASSCGGRSKISRSAFIAPSYHWIGLEASDADHNGRPS